MTSAGRALAVALASRGVQITVLDMMTTKGEETVRLVEEAHAKISYRPNSPSAIFIDCDVTKTGRNLLNQSIHEKTETIDITSS